MLVPKPLIILMKKKKPQERVDMSLAKDAD